MINAVLDALARQYRAEEFSGTRLGRARPSDDVRPQMPEAFEASRRGAEKGLYLRREAFPEKFRAGIAASRRTSNGALDKSMRRRRQIDLLAGEHVEFCLSLAQTFEMRQVRVKIERRDAIQDLQAVK